MHSSLIRYAPAALLSVLLAGCGGSSGSREPAVPGLAVSDAAHGGRAGFYFLPGLAPTTALPSPFGAGFTLDALLALPGGEVVHLAPLAVDRSGRSYRGELDLSGRPLVAGTRYRVRVLSDTEDMGYVDVELASSQAVRAATGEVVALAGGKLPVKVYAQGNPADATVPAIDVTWPTGCADTNGTRVVAVSDGIPFTVSDENLLDVTCALFDATLGIGPIGVACTSPFTYAGGLVDDHVYRLRIAAFDGTNATTQYATWRADAGGPWVQFTSPTSGGSVTLTGTGPFLGTYDIWEFTTTSNLLTMATLDGASVPTYLVGSQGRYQMPGSITSGTHTVAVDSIDCVGNRSRYTASFTVTRIP